MKPGRTVIESPSNQRFNAWRKIAAGQVRKVGRTIVSGRKLVLELATSWRAGESRWTPLAWLVPRGFDGDLPPLPDQGNQTILTSHGGPSRPPPQDLGFKLPPFAGHDQPWNDTLPKWRGRPLTCFELAPRLFRELDLFGTGFPLLEIEVARMIAPLPKRLSDGMYVAVPLQDPANVGALLRSAAGLGASAALLLPGCANPFHPKALRACAGAAFTLPLFKVADLTALARLGCTIVALDASGAKIGGFTFPKKFVILVGREGPGLPPIPPGVHVCKVSLPMDRVQSYNATVAASLAMWEWRRRS